MTELLTGKIVRIDTRPQNEWGVTDLTIEGDNGHFYYGRYNGVLDLKFVGKAVTFQPSYSPFEARQCAYIQL